MTIVASDAGHDRLKTRGRVEKVRGAQRAERFIVRKHGFGVATTPSSRTKPPTSTTAPTRPAETCTSAGRTRFSHWRLSQSYQCPCRRAFSCEMARRSLRPSSAGTLTVRQTRARTARRATQRTPHGRACRTAGVRRQPASHVRSRLRRDTLKTTRARELHCGAFIVHVRQARFRVRRRSKSL